MATSWTWLHRNGFHRGGGCKFRGTPYLSTTTAYDSRGAAPTTKSRKGAVFSFTRANGFAVNEVNGVD